MIFLFSSPCNLAPLLTPGEMGGELEEIRHHPREGAADAPALPSARGRKDRRSVHVSVAPSLCAAEICPAVSVGKFFTRDLFSCL